MTPRRAVVLGGSGLVGGACLRLLLEDPDYAEVWSLGRRQAGDSGKLRSRVVDFARLGETAFPAADALFCCLGATRRKAGSAEAFRRVDFDYVLAAARQALAAGCARFLLVSSQGADARSPFLYPRVKGEIEAAAAALPFSSVLIFRPGLLLGPREESRPLEQLAQLAMGALAPLLAGPLAGLRPIAGETVALAMIRAAKAGGTGVRRFSSREIAAMGARAAAAAGGGGFTSTGGGEARSAEEQQSLKFRAAPVKLQPPR